MDHLHRQFPCRAQQIDVLTDFFLQPDTETPDLLYVFGPHSAGKTDLINRFFADCTSCVSAHVSCIETYTSRLLLESILSQLFSDGTVRACSNMNVLIHWLNIFYRQLPDNKHIIIVLDQCEYLDRLGGEYLKTFTCLRDVARIPCLSVVLVSHLSPYNLSTSTDVAAAVPLYFPQYNKDELLLLLTSLLRQETTREDLLLNYLKCALSVFYRVTRDLSEMSLLARSNFAKYCDPVDCDSDISSTGMALWRKILPHLKASMLSAYSVSGTPPLGAKSDATRCEAGSTQSVTSVAFDLPYFSKYFLIAAYLASYNSARHDKRLYLAHHGKRKKRKTDEARRSKESMALMLVGPQVFHLDRLMAIFYSIVSDKPNLTANLMSQVSTLVELRLLVLLSEGMLDRPSYKCMASLSCVDTIARSLEFNLSKYLMC